VPHQKQWLSNHPALRRTLQILQVPAIILGSLVGGILVQSLVIGQVVLAVYAIAALIFRIDSRTTFILAFLLLCGLVGLLIFRTNNAIATNFAVYTFILLLVGVVSLLREVRERYA
jgi:hypothetical protein